LILPAQVGRVRKQLSPRNQDRAAEEIVDDVDGQFSVEKQNANRLPCRGDVNDKIFALRSESLPNFIGADIIRQLDEPAQSLGKRRALKRAHQFKHGIAPPPSPVMTNLRRSENDTGGDREGVD